MPKKAGIVLSIMGAVLILSALLLFLYNEREDRQAGERAEAALESLYAILDSQMAGRGDGIAGTGLGADPGVIWDDPMSGVFLPGRRPGSASGEADDVDMPVVTVQDYEYIGYLTIPVIDLSLPVISQWDALRLKAAPCRHVGSVYSDDLVIAGHNYDTFFARLGELQEGDDVTFVDMAGQTHRYQVARMETLPPEAVAEVLGSSHALVLYTCTVSAEERIVAFCDRVGTGGS